MAGRLRTLLFWSVRSACGAPEIAEASLPERGAYVDEEFASALRPLGFRPARWTSALVATMQRAALREGRDRRYVSLRGSLADLAASKSAFERLLWQQELQGILVIDCRDEHRLAVSRLLAHEDAPWIDEPPARGGQEICDDVLLRLRKGELLVLHRCTHEKFAIEMPAGVGPHRVLAAAARELGLVHGNKASLLRKRLDAATRRARASVPVFAAARSFASLSVATPAAWDLAFWDTTAIPEGARDLRQLQDVRVTGSSGTTGGAQRVHLLERALARERLGAETPIWNRAGAWRLGIVNRATNAFVVPSDFDRYRAVRKGRELKTTPGANPTLVPAHRFRRVADALRKFDPTALAGDAQFLVGLAPYLSRRDLPSLRQLILSNHASWEFQRRMLAAHFGVLPTILYHSGETGTIATSCRHGTWHMLETYAHYETFARGRPTAAGEEGLLVGTVFDARIRPLLRYALGDIVRLHATSSCPCGARGRTVTLDGRAAFTFRDGRGGWVSPARVDRALARTRGVRYMQVAREERELVLRFVGSPAANIPIEQFADLVGLRVRAERIRSLPTLSVGGKLALFDVKPEDARPVEHFLGT